MYKHFVVILKAKSSHLYLYSALHNKDCFKSASQ